MPTSADDPSEAVSPELDSLICSHPDDPAAWLVFLDCLQQRGDPRAELMRLQLRAPDAQAEAREIAAHWSQWFGALPSDGLACTWRNGFVESARILRPASQASLRSILERRSMRFLRALNIDLFARFTGSLDGLDLPPLLRSVDLVVSSAAALSGKIFPSLEELRLEVRGPLGSLPLTIGLPAIRRVALAQARGLPLLTLIVDLALSPWLPRLEALELRPLGADDAMALLMQRERFRHLGAGLVLHATEDAIARHRADLRAAFPSSQLAPIPSLPGQDASFRFLPGGPSTHAAPRYAPANFRELPPRAEQPVRDGQRCWVGSGVPFTDAHGIADHFSSCMACASSQTLCLHECRQATYSEERDETDHFRRLEYLCRECGRFTSYEASWESWARPTPAAR